MNETEVAREVWEDHDNEAYRQDMSHWRGTGRWKASKWEQIGQSTVAELKYLYACLERPEFDSSLVLPRGASAWGRKVESRLPMSVRNCLTPFRTGPIALEWGPGGGSNLLALSRYCRTLYGVDISEKNLAESARVLKESGYTDFRPLKVETSPDGIVAQVQEPVDIVVSTAVFQHFPSADYGRQVLLAMNRVMRGGALGLIQIRFDDGNPKYVSKPIENYIEEHITATSYGLSEFWQLTVETGFRPIQIRRVNSSVNYAIFHLTKRE